MQEKMNACKKTLRYLKRKATYVCLLPKTKRYLNLVKRLLGCLLIPPSHIGRILWNYVLFYRPRVIVELGTGCSREMLMKKNAFDVLDRLDCGSYMTRIIAVACYYLDKRESIQSHLYTFDILPNPELRAKELISKLRLSKYVTVTSNMDSLEAVKKWNKPIDLLIIDSSHHYKETLEELRQWCKYLKVGGILIMHDIGWYEVRNAKREYFKTHDFERLFLVPQWAGGWKKK